MSPDLDARLSQMCWIVAQIINSEGDLTRWHVESFIPEQAFALAVYAGLIPEPVDVAGGVEFGEFQLPHGEKEEFLARIARPLAAIRKLVDEDQEEPESIWLTPTPRQLIEAAQTKLGSLQKVADEARRVAADPRRYQGDEKISDKTIQRIKNKPPYEAGLPIREALAKMMKLHGIAPLLDEPTLVIYLTWRYDSAFLSSLLKPNK